MVTTSPCYRHFPPKRQPRRPTRSQVPTVMSSVQHRRQVYLASITSLPLGEIPALNVVSDGQSMAINLPEGIQRPGCSGRFSMRRASAPLLCIFWGSPDASCKVATLLIWRAEPIPEPSLLACCLLRRNMAVCHSLQEPSTRSGFSMGSLVQLTQVRIVLDCRLQHLRPESDNKEGSLLPRVVTFLCECANVFDDLVPVEGVAVWRSCVVLAKARQLS